MSERRHHVTPSEGTAHVTLPDLDWGPGGQRVHPPERVVQVCVVNDLTCISLCTYEETGTTSTCTTVADFTVSTQSLLMALVSQLDADVARAALLTFAGPIQDGAQ